MSWGGGDDDEAETHLIYKWTHHWASSGRRVYEESTRLASWNVNPIEMSIHNFKSVYSNVLCEALQTSLDVRLSGELYCEDISDSQQSQDSSGPTNSDATSSFSRDSQHTAFESLSRKPTGEYTRKCNVG